MKHVASLTFIAALFGSPLMAASETHKLLIDDNYVRNEMADMNNTQPGSISLQDIREFREGMCHAIEAIGVNKDKSLHDICASFGVTINPVAQKPKRSSPPSASDCRPNNWCVAPKGLDMLGQPRIEGWHMKEDVSAQVVLYIEPGAKKVNVRGDSGRYISWETLMNYYQSPKAGTAGSTTTYGSSSTNCTGYGYSISCTTTPAHQITTPGSPGRPGGVMRTARTYILDCKDKTYAAHKGNKTMGKWKPISGSELARAKAKRFCSKICPG